jgi:parvulin-like peptidyl-prolyl isomerase
LFRTIKSYVPSLRIIPLLLIMSLLMPSVASAQDEDYVIPPDPEGIDLDLVIGRVDDEVITLGQFRNRVRYDRLRYNRAFESLIGDYGPSVLDFDDPTNQFVMVLNNVINFMVDDRQFGRTVYDGMIMERLYRLEGLRRGLEVDECDVNEYWLATVSPGELLIDCELPEGFDEARDEYLRIAELYTGLSAEDVDRFVVSQAYFDRVIEEVGEELEVPDVRTVRTRHIRVNVEEIAEEVLERLQAGEDFETLLREHSLDQGVEGNAGDLGIVQRGQMVPAFEQAAFSAPVGEYTGPVQTDFGYHVIEVLDQEFQIRVRHILFDNLDDAETAIQLLGRGADFGELAREFSEDRGSAARNGDLGFLQRGQTVPEFDEAAFNAEPGEIVGPVQTQFGYHVLEVVEIGEEPFNISARHILLETEEEAQDVIGRLNTGEDFAELARTLSIDPSAGGHRGDTSAVVSGGRTRGYYAAGEGISAIDAVVFEAEPGELLGPITVGGSYYVVEVLGFDTRSPTETEIARQREDHVMNWQLEQLESDRVEQTTLWYNYVPSDPWPSSWLAELAPLDEYLAQAYVEHAEFMQQTTIFNILRTLTAPVTVQPSDPENGTDEE